jgi:hypothetical protein
MATKAEDCSKGIQTAFANTVRGVALAMWGTQPRDSMLLAEMSVSASINELTQAENNTKRELSIIVDRVKTMQGTKSKTVIKDLLLRSRALRSTLASMGKKRMSMEKQLENLRQSQLNQHMLVSMKHTSEALQKLGLKVTDADNIMLDLEDSNTDINNLQASLSSGFADDNLSDMDLSEELELILSDEYLQPSSVLLKKVQEKVQEKLPEKVQEKLPEKVQELAADSDNFDKYSGATQEPVAEQIRERIREQIREEEQEHEQEHEHEQKVKEAHERTLETVASTPNHL